MSTWSPWHGTVDPTNVLSLDEVQHLWQMFRTSTDLESALPALPAIIRNPCNNKKKNRKEKKLYVSPPRSLHFLAREIDEYLFERRNFSILHIVHAHATLVNQPLVRDLRDTHVRAVFSSEEQNRRPIVGEILLVTARSTRRQFNQIVCGWVHGDVERVAPNDLVQVRREDFTWVYNRVDAVDDELRTCESERDSETVYLRDCGLREKRRGEDTSTQ